MFRAGFVILIHMNTRTLAQIAGGSYLIIFFAAIFANFFMLDAVLNDPVGAVTEQGLMVRLGIMAFLITVVFDVVVAWALYELYPTHHLSKLSTYFRMMHAAIMGVAVFALPLMFAYDTAAEILLQVDTFNIIWLIGLFFFGVHLILLSRILRHLSFIAPMLMVAGFMYMVDTTAHFVLPDYDSFASIFLLFVAVPSILGEMSLSIWLLWKGGKQ